MRIASLCPSNTELLDFMGLTPNIIAVDDSSNYPQEINKLPRLGSDLSIDMDKLASLNPDLVVASLTVPGMEKNIEALEKRKLPFIILNPSSFDNIGENIVKLGELIDNQELADEAYNRYRNLLNECRKEARSIEDKYTVYWEWWPRPVFTPGGENWLTEFGELAGAENIFANEGVASVHTDWEDVANRDPDFIFLNWVGVEKDKIRPGLLTKRPNWTEMQAMKNNRVLVLGDTPFCRPSPRLLMGVKQVRSLLHPNTFFKYDENEAKRWLHGNT